MKRKMVTTDGNGAAAHVAHATNEVIAIYPITPSSPMGEIADAKTAKGERNIWGVVPSVTEMQSEGGAAGAVHGALAAGALTTTFTASQGLLLMIPNMYKIAGELLPTVFHVTARSLAVHALSIFGDHSDVMTCRETGFAMLCSCSVQEAMDFALIAQQATLASRVPFLHFFDGFRTSHEEQKIEELTFDDMHAMIDDNLVAQHKARALTPDRPVMGGTAQNPDVYFQGRETCNPFYLATPKIVEEAMNKFAEIVGRQYKLFDYVGAPDAEKVIIMMGSGAETAHETVEYLNSKGAKVGLLKVRLYRPFSTKHFMAVLPKTVKKIAVLDRTKEPGALGEPLYLDIRTSIGEAMADGIAPFDKYPVIVGGRYGLGSKEFTPAMVKAVFDNLDTAKPKRGFTVGINDDVTHTSLDVDESFQVPSEGMYRAMFYGLGSDGTVGANRNSIKIIGELTDNYAQAYFVYDSRKAGTMTVSHLRFGKKPIQRPYLINQADFVACHNPSFLEKYDMLASARKGGTFLLTSFHGPDKVWDTLPQEVQKQMIDKKLKFYVIDAISLAQEFGLGARINVIMQTAFFKISNIVPLDKAVGAIKDAIRKTYGKRGEKVIEMNNAAVDKAIDRVYEVKVPAKVTSKIKMPPGGVARAPEFVQTVTAELMAMRGDSVPVSKFPVDGRFPVGTTQFEKRNIAVNIPIWQPELCLQCGMCSFVCPHATIRIKAYDPKELAGAPGGVQEHQRQRQGIRGHEVHRPGRAGRLHRLRGLRADLPGHREGPGQAADRPQGHQHGNAGADPAARAEELRVLPLDPEYEPGLVQGEHGQGQPVDPAAVRVFRRLRRLRRDPLCQAADAIVRRSGLHRQRDGVLLHLRRQPADDALYDPQGRPRPDLVQQPLRGQRRIRDGHATDGRSVPPDGAGPSGQSRGDRLRGQGSRGRDPDGDVGRRSGASRD